MGKKSLSLNGMFLSNCNPLQKASLQCRRFLRAMTFLAPTLRVSISTIPNLPLSLIKDGGYNNAIRTQTSFRHPKYAWLSKSRKNAKPGADSALIHLFKFFSYNVLYSFINLTILSFFHRVEIAFFFFSPFLFFSFLCVHLCFSFLAAL